MAHLKYLFNFIFLNFFALGTKQSTALSSTTQHAMPSEFGQKWGTECVWINGFPLPTFLYVRQREWFFYNPDTTHNPDTKSIYRRLGKRQRGDI